MEIEKIKHNLKKKEYNYFLHLQNEIELPLFFIGSITRSDFFPDNSDVDIEVFSNNITSTKLKVENIFNNGKIEKDKYIVFKINGIPFSGCKYHVSNERDNIRFDFTIYKKECQNIILYYRDMEINIPFLFTTILVILKYLRYYLNLINSFQYSYIKKQLWYLYNNQKTTSIVLYSGEYKKFYADEESQIYLIDPTIIL
jgi:hypothetical protein